MSQSTPRRRSLPKMPCRSKVARIRTSAAARCRTIRSRQRSAAISISRPCRKRKPTRRRIHRRASISRGIFARENSPSPRSAFQRAEERSTLTMEVQEANPTKRASSAQDIFAKRITKIHDENLQLLAGMLVSGAAAKLPGGDVRAGTESVFYAIKYNRHEDRRYYDGEVIYP